MVMSDAFTVSTMPECRLRVLLAGLQRADHSHQAGDLDRRTEAYAASLLLPDQLTFCDVEAVAGGGSAENAQAPIAC